MTMNASSPAPGNTPPPAETAGLYCFNCDYDLTGLIEDRCPECGQPFDRDLFRRIAAGEPIPAVPWDTDRTFRGFFKTWWIALTQRGRLASHFPLMHDRTTARLYTIICYIVVWIGLFGLAHLVFHVGVHCRLGEAIGIGVIIATCSVLACCVCEMLTAAGLSWLVPPSHGKSRYPYWRGLTHYTSGYTWLSLIWAWYATFVYNPLSENLLVILSATLLFLWWASGFWIMIRRRGSGWLRIGAACIWVVLCGGASILLGFGLSYVLVTCLF